MSSSTDDSSSPMRPPEGAGEAQSDADTTLHTNDRTLPVASGSRASWQLASVNRDRYVVEGIFAQGGSGRILRAHDQHLDRTVALKELLEPASHAEARFLKEARITARLQHPAIVPIYEAGRWPGGEPFYAMKLVQGRSLARMIELARSLKERLALLPHVLAVADAMAYAHGRRIIHRDLKPANVLVGEFGETVVIDWGLAKELGPEAPTQPDLPSVTSPAVALLNPELTQVGTVVGTPAYMPPEQAEGQTVNERADVYSLGAILYHLLSGRAPYGGQVPHRVLQSLMQGEPEPLAGLQPGLPEELLAIVARAMAREPAQRYPSARELAEDLRRFQTGQLVGAHRYTWWELAARLVRRHRAVLTVAAAALVLLLVGSLIGFLRIVAERNRATQRADELALLQAHTQAEVVPEAALQSLAQISPDFTRWGAVRTLAAAARSQGSPTLLRGHSGPINDLVFSPEGRWLVSLSEDSTVRAWELDSAQGRVLGQHEGEAWYGAHSPTGSWLATSGKDGTTRLWNLRDGRSRVLLRQQIPVHILHMLPGQRLLTSDVMGTLRLWSLDTGQERVLGRHGAHPFMALSGDGRWLASVTMRGRDLWLWDLEAGTSRVLGTHTSPMRMVALSPRADHVATGSSEGQVLLWEAGSGLVRVLGEHRHRLSALAFSPDGKRLASCDQRGELKLWDLATGGVQSFEVPQKSLPTFAFSANGRWLASGGDDGSVWLHELGAGSRMLRGSSEPVRTLKFSPDGELLAAGSEDGNVRLYRVESPLGRVLARLGGPLRTASLSAEGSLLVTGGGDGVVRQWSAQGEPRVEMLGHTAEVTQVHYLPGRGGVVSVDQNGEVRLWESTGGLKHALKGSERPVRVLAVSPEGQWVASGDESGAVWLWETASGQGRRLGSHDKAVSVLSFSPKGLLASGGGDGALWLWETASGQGRRLYQDSQPLVTAAFSADGRYVVAASRNAHLWLQDTRAQQGRLIESNNMILAVTFSRDGRTVFSVGRIDSGVRQWDVQTGQPRRMLRSASGNLGLLALSPDGRRLAAAHSDGTIWLWDVGSGERRALRGHTGEVLTLTFAPDGRRLLSVGKDGTWREWLDELPMEPELLRAWLKEQVRGLQPSSQQEHLP